jgi:metal-responsive CopG/Arc/MetJ family transcriptional regulator
MNKYDLDMAVERVTISLEAELAEAVREAAEADAQNLSAWLADAARRRLASRGLRDVLTEWETEHGQFSEDELANARSRIES